MLGNRQAGKKRLCDVGRGTQREPTWMETKGKGEELVNISEDPRNAKRWEQPPWRGKDLQGGMMSRERRGEADMRGGERKVAGSRGSWRGLGILFWVRQETIGKRTAEGYELTFVKAPSGPREAAGKRTSEVTPAPVLMRAAAGLGQEGRSKGGEKGLDAAFVSQENLMTGPSALDVGHERRCQIKADTGAFGRTAVPFFIKNG